MSTATATDEQRWRKIAAIALTLAIRDDLEEAARYVARLNGTNGLMLALVGWIDTFTARVYPDHTPGEPIAIRWANLPAGTVETAEQVSPSMAWAGRLVAARAAGDQAAFTALLRALPEGAALGDGIMALLHAVATGIREVDTVRAVEAGQA